MTVIRCIDIETTGLDPKEGAEVVEIGRTDVVGTDGEWYIGDTVAMLVKPTKPIPPEMSAIHHLTADMVKDAPPFDKVRADLFAGCDLPCAHQAGFEQLFLPTPNIKWLDTYKGTIALAKNAPSYQLQVLRYWLKLDLDPSRALPSHRAGPDSYVTAALLVRILGKLTVDQLREVSARPAILPRFGFGKHKGVPLEEVPGDYLRWVLDCKDPPFDEDVIATARYYLGGKK